MSSGSSHADTSEVSVPLFSMSIKVRWGDMDAMGHVNNTCYFRYCEQARMEWFSSLDLAASNAPDSRIVIINVFCEFLQPVVYPCTLEIEMSASDVGNSSFMSHYVLREKMQANASAEARIFSNARAKIVWVDAAGTKSIALPDTVREMLTAGS